MPLSHHTYPAIPYCIIFPFLAYCGQFFLNLLTMTLTNKFLLFALREKEFNCVIITKRINGYFCEEKKLHQKPHSRPSAMVFKKRLLYGLFLKGSRRVNSVKILNFIVFSTLKFDEKTCFVVFFFMSENFCSKNIFFIKWVGKVTKIWHLLFMRICFFCMKN